MAAGRKPKPSARHSLEGTRNRRSNNEPVFSGGATCPKHLSKAAKAEWKRVSGELSAQGLLTTVDRAALAAYCSSWARWVDAEEKIQKFGAVFQSPKSGFPIQSPYIGVANTALDHLRKFASEFGMTPSSRSRINVSSAPTTGDPFSDFMASLGAEDTTSNEESQLLNSGK